MTQYPYLFYITLAGGGELLRLVWDTTKENAIDKLLGVFPGSFVYDANIE